MVRGSAVGRVDAHMRVIAGAAPPAAEVDVVLGDHTYALTTSVARVLLERLADSVTTAERYSEGETYRAVLRRQQAHQVIHLRTAAGPP